MKTLFMYRYALTRLRIAGQLVQGVKFDHILDSISDKLERIHLTTIKDLANIEKASGIDDATSVSIWVEEMKERGQNNPVLSYKPQGTLMKDCHNLTKDDFFLVLQTPLQADMLKQFSKIICIYGTHGTNGYDFTLVTLLVVDEFG